MGILTVLVLAGTVLVLVRFSSGNPIDTIRTSVNRMNNDLPPDSGMSFADRPETASSAVPENTTNPAASTEKPDEKSGAGRRSFTLTAAGTVAVDGEIRKNSYLSDVKMYDFSDIMALLKNELQSDLNIVFLENIVDDDAKVSDIVAPSAMISMLKTAGFNMAACGFSRAWDKEEDGISATRMNMLEHGIVPVGIYESGRGRTVEIREYGGIRTAVLQYTDTISASTRKNMIRKGQEDTVPAADMKIIAEDIENARQNGAEIVIVLVNWGKIEKSPDKAQRNLAQSIADAGADIIIGSGSRVPQETEILRTEADSRNVLCVWSLGTTLSGEQSRIRRRSGYLFHAVIRIGEDGRLSIEEPAFTPVYTWKYKQDGRYYYRCLAANRVPPDGMDNSQAKDMEKSAETTRKALEGCGFAER